MIYIAHSARGKITVHSLSNNTLEQIDEIILNVSVDNLSIDSEGKIFVAAFPHILTTMRAIKGRTKPGHRVDSGISAAVWRITKATNSDEDDGLIKGVTGEYQAKKVLEDRDGEVISITTVAVHDAKEDEIFIGGVITGFVAVCERVR